MLACVRSAAVFGIDAAPVNVEVDVSFGLPGVHDGRSYRMPSVRESRDRIRSAIRNSGFEFPLHRITVNLAPADVRKAGSSFDLPIALGMLAATGVMRRRDVDDVLVLGELSLDGGIQAARGVLPIAAAARRRRFAGCLLPAANAREAAVVAGLDFYPVRSLDRSGRRRSTIRSRSLVVPMPVALAVPRDRATGLRRRARPDRWPGARSRLPRRVGTTCCSPARPDRARR